MKLNLKYNLIVIMITYITMLNSCRHEDALFPYTQQGLNRASFLLDDKSYKIDNISYGSDIHLSYISKDSDLYGAITYRDTDHGLFFYLKKIVLKTGRIPFTVQSGIVYSDEYGKSLQTTQGYIDIKYIDSTNKYKRIIAGEFDFDAWNSSLSKSVHISRGNFDSEFDIY